MDPFTAAILLTSGIQIFGQIKANEDEAEAHEQNAVFYREQQRLSEMATRREADIFKRESDIFFGDQVSAFAKSGVDLSGSILQVLVGTKQDIAQEKSSIIETGKQRSKIAGMRAEEARENADRARSSSFLDVLSIGASAGLRVASRNSKPGVSTSKDNFFSGSNDAVSEVLGFNRRQR